MVRRGAKRGTRQKGYWFRKGRCWVVTVNGKPVSLYDDDGKTIKDKPGTYQRRYHCLRDFCYGVAQSGRRLHAGYGKMPAAELTANSSNHTSRSVRRKNRLPESG